MPGGHLLLAEDRNVVREGLRLLLNAQPDIQVVSEAMTGREAIALARAGCADVAVLDISMPGLDGVQTASQILAECPPMRILILTILAFCSPHNPGLNDTLTHTYLVEYKQA